MEPANEPISSDRTAADARQSRMHGCVQARVTTVPAGQDDMPNPGARLVLHPMPLLEAAAGLATTLEPGVTVMVRADGSASVLEDRALAALSRDSSIAPPVAVRLACPGMACVDAGDVEAIAAAVRAGRNPLSADVRATWSLRPDADGVELLATDASSIASLVGEAIARYAAIQLEEPRQALVPPDPELVMRLLQGTGRLLLRPVETQVWAGFLEIGVSMDAEGRERPCETALVYDRPSATWHTEP